ncbi:MAG: hypothetical protein N4A35_01825 [Flavobacteriales bacterium]|jgi:hypothetical protein|nr:hypothetical protein [Flavobacteriales bacterium]
MKIRKELVNQYLRDLTTSGRAVNYPDPMSDLANFDADIRTMRKRLYKDGYLEDENNLIRLCLDDLISRPNKRISEFAGMAYPFNDNELVAIFKRAYETIWPEATLSDPFDEPLFEFVDMSAEDWEAITAGKL